MKDNFQFQKAEFQIFNLLGAKVFSVFINNKEDLLDINIQSLSDGVYSATIHSEKISKQVKLMKIGE